MKCNDLTVPAGMLKIGEFAKLCGVSVQTLRYYDEVGVLCADAIDPDTGYRYYRMEQAETFRSITLFKEMGFSLDEIRLLLANTKDENACRYAQRRSALLGDIRRMREMVWRLDELCRDAGMGMNCGDVPFEDDPEAVGKWELVEGSAPYVEPVLYFLPGGCPYYCYFWTRGILYRLGTKLPGNIANPYRIVQRDGETWMELDWYREDGHPAVTLRYRKVDSIARSEADTRMCRDNVDLPFAADERVLGEWEVCDGIRDIDSFDPKRRWWQGAFWKVGLTFSPRGFCVQKYQNAGGFYEHTLRYTRGVILNARDAFAERYELREIDGAAYLFVEHKSGDYAFKGKVGMYYVYRRLG